MRRGLLEAAHQLMEFTMVPLEFLASWPGAVVESAAAPVGLAGGGEMKPDPRRMLEEAAQRRIALLERQAMDLQRQVDEWQQSYLSLKQQFVESTGRDPL